MIVIWGCFLLDYNLTYKLDSALFIDSSNKCFALHHQLGSHNCRCDVNIECSLDKAYLTGLLGNDRADNLAPSVWQSALGNLSRDIGALEELVEELSDSFWFSTFHR